MNETFHVSIYVKPKFNLKNDCCMKQVRQKIVNKNQTINLPLKGSINVNRPLETIKNQIFSLFNVE